MAPLTDNRIVLRGRMALAVFTTDHKLQLTRMTLELGHESNKKQSIFFSTQSLVPLMGIILLSGLVKGQHKIVDKGSAKREKSPTGLVVGQFFSRSRTALKSAIVTATS